MRALEPDSSADDPSNAEGAVAGAIRMRLRNLDDDEQGYMKLASALLLSAVLVVGGSVMVATSSQADPPHDRAESIAESDPQLAPPGHDRGDESSRADSLGNPSTEIPQGSHQPQHNNGDPHTAEHHEDSRIEGSGCELYGPTVGPSPLVDGGTRLAYGVECGVSHFNSMTVQLRSADGDVLASIAEQTPLLANAIHARQYDIPTSLGALGLPGGVCVSVRVDEHPVENDPSDSCVSVEQVPSKADD